MKKSLLTGALLALMPVAALLPGCGGGNGLVTPTPTTIATATTTPSGTPTRTPKPQDTVNAQLTYTASGDSNFQPRPLFYGGLAAEGSIKSATLNFALVDSSVTFSGRFKNATKGKIYGPESSEFLKVPSITNQEGNVTRVFSFQGGSITVISLGTLSGQIEFKNAIFGANGGGAKGTIIINGTISDIFITPLSKN